MNSYAPLQGIHQFLERRSFPYYSNVRLRVNPSTVNAEQSSYRPSEDG